MDVNSVVLARPAGGATGDWVTGRCGQCPLFVAVSSSARVKARAGGCGTELFRSSVGHFW